MNTHPASETNFKYDHINDETTNDNFSHLERINNESADQDVPSPMNIKSISAIKTKDSSILRGSDSLILKQDLKDMDPQLNSDDLISQMD